MIAQINFRLHRFRNCPIRKTLMQKIYKKLPQLRLVIRNSCRKFEKVSIFILSGPGGGGKTTLINRLFRKRVIKDNFIKGTSFTTRAKRLAEEEGRDYFFVNKEEFLRLKKRNFFLECEKILDDYYGSPKFFYNLAKKEKKNLILCIDVKGGMYLKKNFKSGKIATIFIAAPEKELYCRLEKRAEEKEVIKNKMKLAKKELLVAKHYDHLIVNQDIKLSLKTLQVVLLDYLRGEKEERQ